MVLRLPKIGNFGIILVMPKRPKHKMSMEDRAKQFASFAALGDLSVAYAKKEQELLDQLNDRYASLEECRALSLTEETDSIRLKRQV